MAQRIANSSLGLWTQTSRNIGVSPYYLVYGSETILLADIAFQAPELRTTMKSSRLWPDKQTLIALRRNTWLHAYTQPSIQKAYGGTTIVTSRSDHLRLAIQNSEGSRRQKDSINFHRIGRVHSSSKRSLDLDHIGFVTPKGWISPILDTLTSLGISIPKMFPKQRYVFLHI